MRVLVVEDESRVASFIAKGLDSAGFTTEVVATGAEAIRRTLEGAADLVLLDVGLPDIDGFAALAEIRTVDQATPVIMLTARGDVGSRVRGLELGADDYLPKPFDFEELLARVRARLRQPRQPEAFVLKSGDLALDLRTRQARRADTQVDLTSREFALLEFFLRHEGQVLSRTQILNGVWGYDFDPGSNVVDVYVGYLRSKLDMGSKPDTGSKMDTGSRMEVGETSVIETVRGGGYRLRGRSASDS